MGFLPFTLKASPTVFGLLWASFQDYPPTHWLPLPLLYTCLLHRYSFHDKISFFYSCCIPLPHYLALWHVSNGPDHLLLLLVKIPSQQDIFPKEVIAGNQIQTPLTVGPLPLYWLDTGWWCSGPSVLAPLSSVFVCHAVSTITDQFYFVLPHVVLFLHAFPATFIIFLWFGFSFLHVIPAADTSCRSLFLFVMLFHISFHAYPFIQKNLGISGSDSVDWIKRVLDPICLCLLELFCQETVLYGRSVFCDKSIFCSRFAFCDRYVYKRI